jgi:hypothetical protein
MRGVVALILLALVMISSGAVTVHLRRKASYARWLRRGHADYLKIRPRRGLFG